MTPVLPDAFLRIPLAHRALHDLSAQRPENSRAAIRAALVHGYGIEIDVQLSRDGQAMVFHDYGLNRLTGQDSTIQQTTTAEAAKIPLLNGDGECIPTLTEVLGIVAGQVPLLIELKDQDGAMGPNEGPLPAAVAEALRDYAGPVAVMSFNPHSVAELARLAPQIPRGIVTGSYDPPGDWALSPARCEQLRAVPDFNRVGASFISHEVADLARGRVQELHGQGVPILCWTVKSPEIEAQARRYADNITFEGYLADHPSA